MGTFLGHIAPGLALTLLGLWHAINTIKAYCSKGSSKFAVKFWYPFYGPFSRLKLLELIIIFSFSIFAIIMQLVDFPYFSFVFKLDNFEHATMFLHLAIFAGFALFSEITHSSDMFSGVIGVLAASVFGQELFLLHFHSTDHVGIEGHYHLLWQLIVFVSLIAALVATNFPNSFPAALVLSISVIFQGCWLINMGFSLWMPELVPKGCVPQLSDTGTDNMHGAVNCGSLESDLRARALANLQFSWILSAILLLTICICLKSAGKCTPREQSNVYEQLHNRGIEVPIPIVGFKQENP